MNIEECMHILEKLDLHETIIKGQHILEDYLPENISVQQIKDFYIEFAEVFQQYKKIVGYLQPIHLEGDTAVTQELIHEFHQKVYDKQLEIQQQFSTVKDLSYQIVGKKQKLQEQQQQVQKLERRLIKIERSPKMSSLQYQQLQEEQRQRNHQLFLEQLNNETAALQHRQQQMQNHPLKHEIVNLQSKIQQSDLELQEQQQINNALENEFKLLKQQQAATHILNMNQLAEKLQSNRQQQVHLKSQIKDLKHQEQKSSSELDLQTLLTATTHRKYAELTREQKQFHSEEVEKITNLNSRSSTARLDNTSFNLKQELIQVQADLLKAQKQCTHIEMNGALVQKKTQSLVKKRTELFEQIKQFEEILKNQITENQITELVNTIKYQEEQIKQLKNRNKYQKIEVEGIQAKVQSGLRRGISGTTPIPMIRSQIVK
ncbi:Hypothetical_protein [Hexamita inflata]|uniref:Hypothetical_protein n=1 Tax=Hexamita inflata TaxID=28002 RepID=A0ABP1HI47_9EUKA